MMFLSGSSAGLLAGCTGGVLAASRRQSEGYFLAFTGLGKAFSEVDFEQKTAEITVYPHPPTVNYHFTGP
jgi:hypothetical protein